MELATRNQWLKAIHCAQREHDARIRDVLGQSATQMRAKAGEVYDERLAAMKANVPELKRQGVRTATTVGTAFGIGVARGALGDERFTVRGVPIELFVGVGAHLAGGTLLAGTPAAHVAHGAGDAMLGMCAAHFGREIGTRMRARVAERQAAPRPEAAAAGYAPYGYAPEALPPGYDAPALAAYAGAAPNAADRAMAEAIEIMRAHEPVPRAA